LFDPLDHGERWSSAATFQHLFDNLIRSGEQRLHRPVASIANPSGQAETLGLGNRPRPEPDTLYPTVDPCNYGAM